MDKGKKKNPRASEWSKSGSFMHKPDRGWLHPDSQLTKEAGICYGVRVSTENKEGLEKVKWFSVF